MFEYWNIDDLDLPTIEFIRAIDNLRHYRNRVIIASAIDYGIYASVNWEKLSNPSLVVFLVDKSRR